MKKLNVCRYIRSIVVMSLLAVMVWSVSGCVAWMGSPGETAEEVHRRHKKVVMDNLRQQQDDVDAFWMLDEPSRLSDKITR